MRHTISKYTELFAFLLIFVVLLIPLYIFEADAGIQGLIGKNTPKSNDVYYLMGDFTAPKDDKPFGGDVVGNYIMIVYYNEVKIIAEFEKPISHDIRLEGWLVDFDSGTNFNIGDFNKKSNELFFHQENMASQKYDSLIVIQEPVSETDSRGQHTIGGAQVDVEFFIRNPNRGM